MKMKNEKIKISFSKFIKSLFWLLKLSYKNCFSLIFVILLFDIILSGAVPVVNSVLYKYYIQGIENVIDGGDIFRNFVIVLMVQGGVYILSSVANMLKANADEKYSSKMGIQLRSKIYEKINTEKLSNFESESHYRDYEIALNSESKTTATVLRIFSLIGAAIGLFSVCAIFIYYSPICLVVLLLFQLPVYFINVAESKMNWGAYVWDAKESRLFRYLMGVLTRRGTAKEMYTFGYGDYFNDKLHELNSTLYSRYVKRLVKLRLKSISGKIISYFGVIICYGILIYQILSGRLQLSDTIMLLSLALSVSSCLNTLIWSMSKIYDQAISISNLYDFVHEESTSGEFAAESDVPKEGLYFSNVSFKYPMSDEWAVKNVCIHIKNGQRIAFVGENGAGKTTIVKLALGLYVPNEGCVYYNGIPVSNYNVKDICSAVFQDFCIYDMSLGENISMSENIDKTRLLKAIKKADLASVVGKFKDGTDTMLGKQFNGEDLSKGQWQKIALGRAQYHDKDIIALDEPASALDPIAEKNLIDTCIRATENKISLYVTHRLSTVRNMDMIFVMKCGAIIEQGNHSTLMKLDGLYKELYDMQLQTYVV